MDKEYDGLRTQDDPLAVAINILRISRLGVLMPKIFQQLNAKGLRLIQSGYSICSLQDSIGITGRCMNNAKIGISKNATGTLPMMSNTLLNGVCHMTSVPSNDCATAEAR